MRAARCLLPLALVLCAGGATHAQEWTRCLDLLQGTTAQSVCFGVRPDATAGFDPGLEQQQPPPPPVSTLYSVFDGPGLGNGLRLDLRSSAPQSLHRFLLRIQWGASDTAVVISWDADAIGAVTTTARLQDGFDGALGIDVDMATIDSLVLDNPAITALALTIIVADASESPVRLQFAEAPTATVSGAVLEPQPVVVAVDSAGRVITDFDRPITLTAAPVQGGQGARLSGTTVATPIDGVARFTDVALTVDADGVPVALHAADDTGGLLSAPAFSAEIRPDVVGTQLAFQTLPSYVDSHILHRAITVAAIDTHGAVDRDYADRIELSAVDGPGQLTGQVSAVAVRGVATFDDARYLFEGDDAQVRLQALGAGLVPEQTGTVFLVRRIYRPSPSDPVELTAGPPEVREGIWTGVGPHAGGRILALARGSGGTLYAGTDGAGVFHSDDDGRTWGPMERGLADRVVHDIAIGRGYDRVYAATDAGVYRSHDEGRSWRLVLDGPASGIAALPQRLDVALALAGGLQMTDDGGDTWRRVDPQAEAAAVAVEAAGRFVATDRTVYAVVDTGLVRLHATGLPAGVTRVAFAADDDAILYAGSRDSLHVSRDRGRSWTSATTSAYRYSSFGALTLLAADSILYAGGPRGIQLSRDRGATWEAIAVFPNPPTNPQGITEAEITDPVRSLAFGASGALVAGGDETGFHRRLDSGAWAMSNAGLAILPVTVETDPRVPGRVYATARGQVFRTDDGGGSWRRVLHVWSRDDRVSGIRIHPRNPEVLITFGFAPIRMSADAGATWDYLHPEYLFPTDLAISPTDPAILYGTPFGSGVARSDDGGHTWQWVDVPGTFRTHRLRISPDGATVYLATSAGLYRSATAHHDWAPVDGGLSRADVRALVLHRRYPATLLAGTGAGHLWRSADGGDTWTDLGAATPDGAAITAIAAVPDSTEILYVGTEDAGVWVSRDGAWSWSPLSRGLASTRIGGLAVDLSARRLYAATERAGLFVTALPEPSTAVASEAATPHALHLEPAFPNPFNAAIQIRFSLQRRTRARLQVVNAAGQVVTTVVDQTLAAGPHRAVWGGTAASGAPAASGTYFLRLRADGAERVTAVQLIR